MVLAPVWGIVVASIIAEIASELIDTEAYSRWVARFGEDKQWGRVLFSNAIAIPVDSAVFVGLATLFGVFPPEVAWSILWVECGPQGVDHGDLDPLDLLGPPRAAGGDLHPKWPLM